MFGRMHVRVGIPMILKALKKKSCIFCNKKYRSRHTDIIEVETSDGTVTYNVCNNCSVDVMKMKIREKRHGKDTV